MSISITYSVEAYAILICWNLLDVIDEGNANEPSNLQNGHETKGEQIFDINRSHSNSPVSSNTNAQFFKPSTTTTSAVETTLPSTVMQPHYVLAVPPQHPFQTLNSFTTQVKHVSNSDMKDTPLQQHVVGMNIDGQGGIFDQQPVTIVSAFSTPSMTQVPPLLEVNKKPGRRVRTTFSVEQKQALEQAFEKTPYPDAAQREQIAVKSQLPEARVQVIFSMQYSSFIFYNIAIMFSTMTMTLEPANLRFDCKNPSYINNFLNHV